MPHTSDEKPRYGQIAFGTGKPPVYQKTRPVPFRNKATRGACRKNLSLRATRSRIRRVERVFACGFDKPAGFPPQPWNYSNPPNRGEASGGLKTLIATIAWNR